MMIRVRNIGPKERPLRHLQIGGVRVYIDTRDWWIGYYGGPNHHYVCLLPTVVVRWRRR